jgi:hypothetical protein
MLEVPRDEIVSSLDGTVLEMVPRLCVSLRGIEPVCPPASTELDIGNEDADVGGPFWVVELGEVVEPAM